METQENQLEESYIEYPLSLAIFDSVPVILFFITGILINAHFHSPLFMAGVIAAFLGGSSKALWKIIVVLRQKDIVFLTKAFRILMFGGFGIMLAAVIAGAVRGKLAGFIPAVITMPSCIFFLLGVAGMFMMGYLGSHMDDSARSNWIEEAVNAASQAAFLIGMLML